jgi:very-short-patch-repair endonuclease
MSDLEETLLLMIRIAGVPVPEREYRFLATRKWRFDFAYPAQKIGIEVEGGTWSGGRHTRGVGFEQDCRKYNQATQDGWKVYRFTNRMILSGEAVEVIIKALETTKLGGK